METGTRRDAVDRNWRETESISDAVRRLCRAIDERKERRASGAQSPEQIAYPDVSPSGERADGENDHGVSTFDRRPQLTDNREEVAGGSRMVGGRAALASEPIGKGSPTGCARPNSDFTCDGADRAEGVFHAPRIR